MSLNTRISRIIIDLEEVREDCHYLDEQEVISDACDLLCRKMFTSDTRI